MHENLTSQLPNFTSLLARATKISICFSRREMRLMLRVLVFGLGRPKTGLLSACLQGATCDFRLIIGKFELFPTKRGRDWTCSKSLFLLLLLRIFDFRYTISAPYLSWIWSVLTKKLTLPGPCHLLMFFWWGLCVCGRVSLISKQGGWWSCQKLWLKKGQAVM